VGSLKDKLSDIPSYVKVAVFIGSLLAGVLGGSFFIPTKDSNAGMDTNFLLHQEQLNEMRDSRRALWQIKGSLDEIKKELERRK
jgi:hypothetical protein